MNTGGKEVVMVREGPMQSMHSDQGTEGNREPWRDTHLWGEVRDREDQTLPESGGVRSERKWVGPGPVFGFKF